MTVKKKTASEMREHLEYIAAAYADKIKEELISSINNEVLLSKAIDSPKEIFRVSNTINLTAKIRQYLTKNDLHFRNGEDFYRWLKTT